MTPKKDETETPVEEPTPANQSPETLEDEEVDLDALIDAKLKEREDVKASEASPSEETETPSAGAGPTPSADRTEGDGGTTATQSGQPSKDAAVPSSPVSVVRDTAADVEAAVERVLNKRDHDAEHAKLGAPKPPKKRKGLAALLMGQPPVDG